MVQNEDRTHEKLLIFNRLWTINFAEGSLLVFSTGRSPTLFTQLWDEAPLLNPHILICSVGSEIFYRCPTSGKLLPDSQWEAALDAGWDRARVLEIAATFPELKPQVSSEQRRHKLSYHLQRSTAAEDAAVLQRLCDALAAAGLAAKVVYSGGVDVDILAAGAGKGKALEFVLAQLRERGRWPPGGVQVNGDSGNDIELFKVPGVRGCVVANAHPELLAFYQQHAAAAAGPAAAAAPAADVYLAQQPCAGGIVEALMHFGSVPAQGLRGALRATLVQLGMVQSNPLAGDVSLLAQPGATWLTPAGRLLRVTEHMAEPAECVAGGVTWVDDVALREVEGQRPLMLATYRLWSFQGLARACGACRMCSALLECVVDGGEGVPPSWRLLHLHESSADVGMTPTAAFAALADAAV